MGNDITLGTTIMNCMILTTKDYQPIGWCFLLELLVSRTIPAARYATTLLRLFCNHHVFLQEMIFQKPQLCLQAFRALVPRNVGLFTYSEEPPLVVIMSGMLVNLIGGSWYVHSISEPPTKKLQSDNFQCAMRPALLLPGFLLM